MSPHPNLLKDHVAEGVASHYPSWGWHSYNHWNPIYNLLTESRATAEFTAEDSGQRFGLFCLGVLAATSVI